MDFCALLLLRRRRRPSVRIALFSADVQTAWLVVLAESLTRSSGEEEEKEFAAMRIRTMLSCTAAGARARGNDLMMWARTSRGAF